MLAIKVIGLGTLLSVIALVVYVVFKILTTQLQHGNAVGLSALRASTLYNPYFWLVLIAAYGAAFWVVKNKR